MIALAVAAQMLVYVDAGSLRQKCESTDLIQFAQCNEFVTAVNDTVAATTPSNGKPPYCIPKGMPRMVLVAAFRSYYDNLPGLADMSAATVIIAGLQTSFPCKK